MFKFHQLFGFFLVFFLTSLSNLLDASEAIDTKEENKRIKQTMNIPGGVAKFDVQKLSDEIIDVHYGLTEPTVIDRGDYWTVIIGIGLNTLPGEYVSYVKHGSKDIPGLHKKITVQHYVYPFISTKKNSKDEFSDLYQTYKSFSDIDFSNTQQPNFPLQLPLAGQWSSHFGNSIDRGSKLELLVPNAVSLTTTQLASVVSPHNAIVSKIETTDNGLKRVFLDHGRGVYSIISGLSDLTVEITNGIVAGAVIGKLPADSPINNGNQKTNNSKTLIWQTVMNGEYVNPLLLSKLAL